MAVDILGQVGGIASGFGTALIILIIVLATLTVVGVGLWAYLRHRKYNAFKVVLFEKDGFGQWQYKVDRAGIFLDRKTNNKRFFLQKGQVGLEPDTIPYLTDARGKRVVFLLRLGLKNFRFLRVNFIEPKPLFEVGEEDVNWAINSYEKAKTRFSQTLLMQILPYAMLAIVSMVIMVIFIYLFKKLDVIADMAVTLKEAAQILVQAKSGAIIQ